MSVFFRDGLGKSEWAEVDPGTHHVISPVGAFLMIRAAAGPSNRGVVLLNGHAVECDPGAESCVVPFVPNDQGICVLTLVDEDGVRPRYEFVANAALEPDTRLKAKLQDFRRRLRDISDGNVIRAGQLYGAIANMSLPLLAVQETFTAADEDWLLDEIEAAIPFLLRACDKPRTHLRTEEAVRPIEVVTRSGPAALRHLASHSEHWEARTVGGLRPVRLLAQITEDDLSLYENRFVKTLIDRLVRHVLGSRREVERALGQAENALDWDHLASQFSDYRRLEMLTTLFPTFGSASIQSQKSVFQETKHRIVRIQRILTSCVASRFYQALRHCEPVSSPIRPTNILTMDPAYKWLFHLWLELDRDDHHIEEAVDGSLPADTEGAYRSFCQVMLLQALKSSRFAPLAGDLEQVGVLNDDGSFQITGRFVRDNWSANLSMLEARHTREVIRLTLDQQLDEEFDLPADIDVPPTIPADLEHIVGLIGRKLVFRDKPTNAEKLHLSRLFHSDAATAKRKGYVNAGALQRTHNVWASFVDSVVARLPKKTSLRILLVPVFSELGVDVADIRANTKMLLNAASHSNQTYGATSTLILIPSAPRELPDSTPADVARRLCNLGDCFTEEDSRLWGNRVAGLLSISPWQLNSLLRLTRTVKSHMLRVHIENAVRLKRRSLLEACPVCEGYRLRMEEPKWQKCLECGSEWGVTRCPSPDCAHEFAWLRTGQYRAPQMQLEESAYGRVIEALETAAGESAVTAYCESRLDGRAVAPICPKCGRCPRSKDSGNSCLRCVHREMPSKAQVAHSPASQAG